MAMPMARLPMQASQQASRPHSFGTVPGQHQRPTVPAQSRQRVASDTACGQRAGGQSHFGGHGGPPPPAGAQRGGVFQNGPPFKQDLVGHLGMAGNGFQPGGLGGGKYGTPTTGSPASVATATTRSSTPTRTDPPSSGRRSDGLSHRFHPTERSLQATPLSLTAKFGDSPCGSSSGVVRRPEPRGLRSPTRSTDMKQQPFGGPRAAFQTEVSPPKVQPQAVHQGPSGFTGATDTLTAIGISSDATGHRQVVPPKPLLPNRVLNSHTKPKQGGAYDDLEVQSAVGKKEWLCSETAGEFILSACANSIHTSGLEHKVTLPGVREWIDATLRECEYHHIHLVLALIYLERFKEKAKQMQNTDHENPLLETMRSLRVPSSDPDQAWKQTTKEVLVALHLADAFHPFDGDASLTGKQVAQKHKWQKGTLEAEQWNMCKMMEWKLMVDSDVLSKKVAELIEKKKRSEATKFQQKSSSRGPNGRGGMTCGRPGTCPPGMNRGQNCHQSSPAVSGTGRSEMMSPKGMHSDESRQGDKANDEASNASDSFVAPASRSAIPERNPMIPRAGPLGSKPQGTMPSRQTVGGVPHAAQAAQAAQANGFGAAGNNRFQFNSVRGRDGRNAPPDMPPRNNDLLRQAAPPPATAQPHPSTRMNAGCPPSRAAFPGGGVGPSSALDTNGASIRVGSAPGDFSSSMNSGVPRTPTGPTTSHTPRHGALGNSGLGGHNRSGPGPLGGASGHQSMAGGSSQAARPYGMTGASPHSHIATTRGAGAGMMPYQRR